MPKCGLQIFLDRGDRTYKLGEPISGVVEIKANADFHCRKITLVCEWRARGSGNQTVHGEQGAFFAEEENLRSGEAREYPFRFAALRGPVSYQGKLLNVEWYLRAQVDIAMAVDAMKEEKFLLGPGETSGEIILGTEKSTENFSETSSRLVERMARARVLGVPFFLIGLVMLYFAGSHPLTITLSLAVAGLGAWQIFLLLSNKLAQRKLGEIEVNLDVDKVRAADTIECKVSLPSQHAARLQKIVATLKGEERVMTGSGNYRRLQTHTIHQHVVEQLSRDAISDADKLRLTVPLQIPATAPSTFHAPDNAVAWFIRVQIDIRGWPDWVQEFPLTIVP